MMEYYSAMKGNELLIHAIMDEPQKHHAEWKKTVTKGPILHDSIHMKAQNKEI